MFKNLVKAVFRLALVLGALYGLYVLYCRIIGKEPDYIEIYNDDEEQFI